jgi:hypothetical protein
VSDASLLKDFADAQRSDQRARKPAAYAQYELSLMESKATIPERMKDVLRIYMNSAVATKPCRQCRAVAVALNNRDHSVEPRRAMFGGLCVVRGKQSE